MRDELRPGVRGVLAAVALGAGAAAGGVLALRRGDRRRRGGASTAVRRVDLERGEIRLAPTPDALAPGRYSIWFAGGSGHARVGEVLRREGRAVVRRLLGVDLGDLGAAEEVRFNGWMHLGPATLDLPWRTERVRTAQGSVPAWTVPGGEGRRWAVLVHGRSSTRQEALRAVPVLHAAGLTALLPAYRGDGEAPDGARARYALEDAEWVDVESAVAHALEHGAREVVLVAFSSGASIALATAHRSGLRSVVRGVVLDSPLLGRWDDPAEPDAPVLILHGEDDGVAPIAASRAFAAARADRVVLVPFDGGRHTRLWNRDPDRWDGALAAWLGGDAAALARLSRPGTASGRTADRSRRAAGRRGARRRERAVR
ncbi:alpha/beta hydrolase [Amnibacterium endophyticum]|uniref:Alpha/beta hydrolase n=1 Tax=Amnibacterium endophyticum TaxID=2109337 RepID=A0ABW4LHX4_9MICO